MPAPEAVPHTPAGPADPEVASGPPDRVPPVGPPRDAATGAGRRIAIRGPADVVAAVPYLLGHVPAACLVALSVRPDGLLGVVCRADLPDPGLEGAAAAVADRVVAALTGDRAANALLLLHEDDPGPARPPAARRALLDTVDAALAAHGVAVTDVLHVGPTRWRSLRCADVRCCPPAGRPVADTRDNAVAAAFVLAGRSPAADRSSLEPAPEPASPADRRAAAQAGARWRRRVAAGGSAELPVADRFRLLDEWLAVLDRHAATGALPGPAVTGRLATAWSHDLRIRDACMVAALPGAGVTPDAIVAGSRAETSAVLADRSCAGAVEAVAPVLRHLAAHVGGPPAAAALAVHAWLAWASGDGAAAGDLCVRALAAEPDHRLASLVLRALDHAVPPDWAAPAPPVNRPGAGT
jgi:hypothetical protein